MRSGWSVGSLRGGEILPQDGPGQIQDAVELPFAPLDVAGDGGDVDVKLTADLAVVEALDVVQLQTLSLPGGDVLPHGPDQSTAEPGQHKLPLRVHNGPDVLGDGAGVVGAPAVVGLWCVLLFTHGNASLFLSNSCHRL